MMWINRANRYGVLCFLTALLYAGFAQLSIAFAQSVEHEPSASNRIELIPGGSAFGPGGILPSTGTAIDHSVSRYGGYGIALNPQDAIQENSALYWLEFGGMPHADHGVNARIGLGYSPSRDLGFSVGPFLDLDTTSPNDRSIYQTDTFGRSNRGRSSFGLTDLTMTRDAGLAGSLSYMPLEDIWIGLHGTVSRDLTTGRNHDGFLDGIDAMLGLTARYRIEF